MRGWDIPRQLPGLTGARPVLAEAVTDRDGVAVLAGREGLERGSESDRAPDDRFMVRVEAGKDMALLPLDATFTVDTYRASRGTFWSAFTSERNHTHAWGTTAQGVYKLGDTVQYKVYLRDQDNLTLTRWRNARVYELNIVDRPGKTVRTEPTSCCRSSGRTQAPSGYPPSGAVGWYEFNLKGPAAAHAQGADAHARAASWTPMRVLFRRFHAGAFPGRNTLNGQLYQPGDTVEVATRAALHAGGPYANCGIAADARLFPQDLDITDPAAAGFEFASVEPTGNCTSHQRARCSDRSSV